MSSKSRRGGADRARESGESGAAVDRKMIETIREATGATEDDIRVMLFECNYDANETTSRLIDNPFSQVQSKKDKKKKREEDRKKEPTAKIVEVRRASSQGGGKSRGHDRERGPRGERSERSFDRGPRNHQSSSSIPEKPLLVSTETPAPSGWDHIPSSQTDFGSSEQPATSPAAADTGSHGWGSSSPGLQPIAPPVQPAPIQPPGARPGGVRSMADLFKTPQEPAPVGRPIAGASVKTAAPSKPAPADVSEQQNGWGSLHTGETDSLQQGGSLGGIAVSPPQKAHGSQPLLGTSTGSAPLQTPVGSASHGPLSPGRQLDEEVPAPSTTGLGGVPVEAPPRQYADSQPQSSWPPKAAAGGQPPTLGSSILSSLVASSAASPAPLGSADPLAPSSQSHHSQDLGLGGSNAFAGSHSSVILPPGAQQSNSADLGGLSFQFGNFGLGSAGPELGGGFASGYEAASTSLPESQHSASAPSSAEPYRVGSYSQPQSSLGQATQLPPQQQHHSQQQQQQRAYNAFNTAVQPQAVGTQRPSPSTSSELQGSTTQGLYSSQAYPTYGAGQGYGQYPSHTAGSQSSQFHGYGFQAPFESGEQSTASNTTQPSVPAPAKRQERYDTSSYAAYGQGQSQGQGQGQSAGGKDFPATKFGGSSQHQQQQQSHLTGMPAGPTNLQNAAAVAAQTPLSQLATGYGAGQMGVGGMGPQSYGYAGQQYGNYPQQYNNYAAHPGSSYGYGGGSGQTGYQQGGYGGSNSSYGQGAKYGRANYAGTGGSGYQQHAGGFGAQNHKDKEHQGSHLGGHDLYGQQQVPVGGQQHYQGAGLRDHSNYGYQHPAAGYGGYNMGRQYTPPYYGGDHQ